MRYFVRYTYLVGRKAEFRDLFSMVDSFLSEQKLGYSYMAYDLSCFDYEGVSSACHKLNKKLPQMGQIEIVEEPYTNKLRISNLDLSGRYMAIGDEESIRFVGSKIPRPFGFHYTSFFYCGIPFLGRVDERMYRRDETHKYLESHDLLGNFIMLSRNLSGPQSTTVTMVMEIGNHQDVDSARAYSQQLSKALGGVKWSEDMFCWMCADEQERYDLCHIQALDAVRSATSAVETMVEEMVSDRSEERELQAEPRFSLSKPLKKIGKSFGYGDYAYDPFGAYSLVKETEHGHKITLVVDMGPMFRIVRAGFFLSGVGFAYGFQIGGFTPNTQDEADLLIREVFSILQRIEDPYLTQIGANYPDSPPWMRGSLSSIYCKLRKNRV